MSELGETQQARFYAMPAASSRRVRRHATTRYGTRGNRPNTINRSLASAPRVFVVSGGNEIQRQGETIPVTTWRPVGIEWNGSQVSCGEKRRQKRGSAFGEQQGTRKRLANVIATVATFRRTELAVV